MSSQVAVSQWKSYHRTYGRNVGTLYSVYGYAKVVVRIMVQAFLGHENHGEHGRE